MNAPDGTPSARELEIQVDIEAILEVGQEARAAQSYTPAVAAIARAAGLRCERRRATWARIISSEPDDLTRVRHRVSAATEDGSWAAVSALSSLEREIVATRAAELAAIEERKRQAGDPQAIMAALVETIHSLPPGMQDEIRAMLGG